MKKILPIVNYKSALLLLISFISLIGLKAQLITYPIGSGAQAITRGLDSTLLTVRIDFPNCTNPVVTINLGATNSPGIIEYIPGSVTKTSGSAGILISQSNISDLQNPVFSVSSTTAGQFIVFTIKRRANCGSAAASKDFVKVTGGCTFSEIDPNVNTYNLLAPALTLTPPAALSNVNVGSSYNRTIILTNGGNGCLDTLGFWIKYPTGSLTLNSLQIGATTLTPLFSNADSAYFRITGTILSADKLLCNGESVTFVENITVKKCNATTTYGANWRTHIGDVICETATTQSGMTMSNNLPNLTLTMPSPNSAFCADGTFSIQKVRITNSGAGPATDFKIKYWGFSAGAFYFSYTDTSNWVVKNSSGTTVGTMSKVVGSNPTVWADYRYNSSCVIDQSWFDNNVELTLPGLIIPAGDYVEIEFRVYHTNVKCVPMQCYPDYYGWENDELAFTYKDQCGNGNNNSPRTSYYSTAYPRAQYMVQGPPDINAGPFNLKINYSSLITSVRATNGRSYIFIKLPTDITLNSAPTSTLVAQSGASYPATLPYFQRNDTVFIPMNVPYSFSSGVVTFPLLATCGSGGVKDFKIGHLHWWDSINCPTAKLTLACQTFALNLHCPGCNIGGATPLDFQLKRINYGYPDANDDNYPDALTGTPNLSLINLNNALNGDTMLGTWKVKVYANVVVGDPNVGVPFNHFYIDYPLTLLPASHVTNGFLNYPYMFNPLPNAAARIYPAGGGAAINCTVSPTIINDIAHYDFSSCKSLWNAGDSIVVEAKYVIGSYNHQGGYTHQLSSAQVYSSYAPQSSPTSAPIANTTYTCDHFQSYVDAINSYTYPYNYDQIVNGCANRELYVGSEFSMIDNGAPIKFPYESRLISFPNSVSIRMPAGFTYEANSAYIQQGAYGGFNGGVANTLSIPAANVSVSGNYLNLTNLNTLFTKFGGTNTMKGEYANLTYRYKVVPTCNAISGGVVSTAFDIVTTGNGFNTPSAYHSYTVWNGHHPSDSTVTSVTYNAPQPVFSGGGTVTSSDGSATWTVVLQNASNSLAASNSWFYISPKNGLTNIVVKEGASTITPDVNGFYHLGDLLPSANRNFTVTAKAGTCATDSMKINSGFDCVAYPTSFVSQSCTQSAWLKINNYPSQIQLIVTKQPTSPNIPLCSGEYVEFVINSAQAAFADNPEFRVTPPTGVIVTASEMEYPLGSGNWQTVTPTIAAGVYSYLAEAHTQLTTLWGTRGLPGTIDYAGTDQRQIKLKITFVTDCNFTSGAKMTVQQRADRPCGIPIPTGLGYNNIVRTDPINIIGAGTTAAIAFSLGLVPPNVNCGKSNLGGSITPILSATGTTDTVVVTLSSGIAYNGNFVGAPNVTFVGTSPGAGGSTKVKLKVASGIAPGTSASYSFDVIPTDASGCGSFDIVSEAERSFAPLVCITLPSPSFCPNNSKAIVGSAVNTLTVNKPQIVVSNLSIVSGLLYPSSTVKFNLVANNISPTVAAPASSLKVDFMCGSSSSAFGTQFYIPATPALGTSNSDLTVTIPASPTCNVGELVRAVIRPVPGSCLCDSSGFLYAVPLPVDFLNFTATKTGNNYVQLFWSISAENNGTTYQIERKSSNQSQFASIGAIPGSGASSSAIAYTYTDNNTAGLNNVVYYRIKTVAANGQFKYSEPKAVTFNGATMLGDEFAFWPNPANNELTISSANSEGFGYRISDMTGRVLESGNSRTGMTVINVSQIPVGVYVITITDAVSGKSKQLVINK